MSDKQKKFHQLAIQSILFKGRSDWYFCYLKAEKIAHVLAVLSEKTSPHVAERLEELATTASELPGTVAHFAAGEVEAEVVLADLFSLLSLVRLASSRGLVGPETGHILAAEYESLAERFATSIHLSPFATVEDFTVPQNLSEEEPLLSARLIPQEPAIKDTQGQHSKQHSIPPAAESRTGQILDFVLKNKGVSIKDIAAVVRGCSEKTIQRELGELVRQGLIKKIGERRWSQYLPA